MRKVIFAMNMSIDGCISHTSFMPDEDTFGYWNDWVHEVDLIVYGRKMYEIMFPYWALEENRESKLETEFGERLTDIEKVVFSRTLTSAEYNARVVNTDPVEEMRKLKQAPGGNISLSTVSMVPLFAQAGLIDEYRLVVHPVIVGQGPRLVEDGSLTGNLGLALVATKTFKSGSVALHYKKQA